MLRKNDIQTVSLVYLLERRNKTEFLSVMLAELAIPQTYEN